MAFQPIPDFDLPEANVRFNSHVGNDSLRHVSVDGFLVDADERFNVFGVSRVVSTTLADDSCLPSLRRE